MNRNPAIQNTGLLAWDGTTGIARDISTHINFGFTFEATAPIAADAVFKFQSAPASAANKCLPGAFTDILAPADCRAPAVGTASIITIPAGTVDGQVCSGTIPCTGDGKFIRIVSVSGDTANLRITLILQGPK